MMRIITGIAKGIKLKTLPGDDITRPTSERVKQGLFNALQFDISGKRVLDLFAGTGQLGLEALSRGADFAILIDENDKAVQIIKENAIKSGLIQKCKIIRTDYSAYLKSVSGKERFSLVFIDPPYSRDVASEVLKKLSRADILENNALIVCETDSHSIEGDLHGFILEKNYRYGRVYISILRKPQNDDEDEKNE